MKILLVSVGTRGDMEPMLAVGEIMRDKGHQVICAFPEQFAFLAEESNMAFASQIPYEWIFPQVYGVIHHGGSGTTHMALTHGRASMIVPHIIDQFVWDSINADLGAGPRGDQSG